MLKWECIYCCTENIEQKTLIELLDKLLLSSKDNVISTTINKISSDLLQLHLSGLNIDSVSSYLDKCNYKLKLENALSFLESDTDVFLQNNFEEINYLLFTSYINENIPKSKETLVTNYLSNMFLNNKLDYIDEDDKVKFVGMIAVSKANLMGLPKLKVNVKQLDEDTNAYIDNYNYMTLSKNLMKNGNELAFVTIFHEIIHAIQNMLIKNNYLSTTVYLGIKDRIIKKLSKTYYHENYTSNMVGVSFEIEAFFQSYEFTSLFFDSIGYKPSIDYYADKLINHKKYKAITDTTRMYNSNEEDLNDLFDKIIIGLDKTCLEKYPQLSLEYKLEEDVIVRKNSIEIENDYKNYKLGQSKWAGEKEEVCFLYEEVIKRAKSLELDSLDIKTK